MSVISYYNTVFSLTQKAKVYIVIAAFSAIQRALSYNSTILGVYIIGEFHVVESNHQQLLAFVVKTNTQRDPESGWRLTWLGVVAQHGCWTISKTNSSL